jgi:hypothetical protein
MPTCSNSGRLTLGFPWTLVRTSHPILVNLDSCGLRYAAKPVQPPGGGQSPYLQAIHQHGGVRLLED